MKILHLAPLWLPIARDSPGGIETLLSGLIGALERLGCQNTLIASGDSRTLAELVPVVPRCLVPAMKNGAAGEYAGYEQHQLQLALERSAEFDVVHSHIGWGGYVLSAVPGLQGRVLHTQHDPVSPDLEWYVRRHPDLWMSTVSEFQARKLRRQGVARCRVIHNGVDVSAFSFQPQGGEGLLFIGRIEDDKGPAAAVRVARALGRSLILAGPIVDAGYFNEQIRPFLTDRIQYVGVVGHQEKNELFGQAGCVLMPSTWDEPFGLVAAEAIACGTPVVALASGALSEIVEPGVTGYLAQDEAGLPELVNRAMELHRGLLRTRAAARFDLQPTAESYRGLYAEIARERHFASNSAGEANRGALRDKHRRRALRIRP